MPHARIFAQLALAACLLAIAIEGSATPDSQSEPPITAIWRVQQLELNFRSPRIHYSCDGLKHKITAILAAVGARKGIDVDVPCRVGTLTNNALARITLATPIEATRENVQSVTTYSPQMQLAARVNGLHLPSANDVERFNAQWQTVALHKQRRLGLDAGDCDLLRNLSTQVFPQLGVRLEERRLSCPSSSSSRIRPKLHVMALIAVPALPVAYVEDQTAR